MEGHRLIGRGIYEECRRVYWGEWLEGLLQVWRGYWGKDETSADFTQQFLNFRVRHCCVSRLASAI
jgi:hypothetical protein